MTGGTAILQIFEGDDRVGGTLIHQEMARPHVGETQGRDVQAQASVIPG